VPGYFMVLAQFPLSANGKVDRKQLPMPETPAAITEYVAPGSPLEELVAGIWADVLALERVGVEDNFFQIGGHSLLAMRLLARIQEAVQIELTPRQLFDAPTVAAMCRMVEEAILRQIESMSEEEALALTHATDN
ncbi:MAG TPA: phosphopantetheine-binding protein, partial [Noviherbaspirillum sp.]